jgi:hypothetical protein
VLFCETIDWELRLAWLLYPAVDIDRVPPFVSCSCPITSQTTSTATTPAYQASPQAASYCRFVCDSLQCRPSPLRRSLGRPLVVLRSIAGTLCAAWHGAQLYSAGPFNLCVVRALLFPFFLVYSFLYRRRYLRASPAARENSNKKLVRGKIQDVF